MSNLLERSVNMTKYEKARNLRYKRGALASIGFETLMDELYEIEEACSEIHWFFEEDGDNLIAAMDGDEDEAYEFKMAFADLEAKCEKLRSIIDEEYGINEYYDDCTLALIGNRYEVVGFDSAEEDYYSLCRYEADLATTEAGKRVMRLTKGEMLSRIGQCMGLALAFLDLRQNYDYLKATMDILRDKNMSVLNVIKEINKLYENSQDYFEESANQEYQKLLNCLPEYIWLQ